MWRDTTKCRADLQIRSPLVTFNHVTDPHFVAFFSSLYTTIRNPNPNTIPNPNHNPNRSRNHNTAVITDPQIGLIDPQNVTVLIRPADPLRILSRAPSECQFPVVLHLSTWGNAQTPMPCPCSVWGTSERLQKISVPHFQTAHFSHCTN